MASCSVPGCFAPASIAERRYVDGGAVPVTNVDVLRREHLDEVLVLAPMATYEPDHPRTTAARLERRLRQLVTRRLDWEAGRLTATGTEVRVFAPTAEDLAIMGPDLMNAGRRTAVFDTAVRTTSARLATAEGAPGRTGLRSARHIARAS